MGRLLSFTQRALSVTGGAVQIKENEGSNIIKLKLIKNILIKEQFMKNVDEKVKVV